MAVRQRGNVYMADFMVAGTRHRETFDTAPQAEAWELETRAAIIRGSPMPAPRNGRTETGGVLSTLGDLFDYTKAMHWENNPKIVAPQTAVASAREAVEFFGRNKLVKDIDTDEMRRFARSIVASGRAHTTADRKLAALSKMMRFAAEKGVINRTPKVPLSGEKNERLRFLSKEEAHKLLKLWTDWDQPDLHAFTTFALHSGARLSAILKLTWGRIGPELNSVFFLGGKDDKNSMDRTLPIPEGPVRDALRSMKARYPGSRGPFAHMAKGDGKLRVTWDKMQAQFDWDDVVIHTLRHTCASWMIQKTGDLRRVQTWLGHKRIETTLIYAKLATGDLDAAGDILSDMLTPPKPPLSPAPNL